MRSQADIYRALLNGRTLVNCRESFEVTLNEAGMVGAFSFISPVEWKIKEEPKKLYAYEYKSHIVFDKGEHTRIHRTDWNGNSAVYEPCPEYDLEYPND